MTQRRLAPRGGLSTAPPTASVNGDAHKVEAAPAVPEPAKVENIASHKAAALRTLQAANMMATRQFQEGYNALVRETGLMLTPTASISPDGRIVLGLTVTPAPEPTT